jgi:hypothetical protein
LIGYSDADYVDSVEDSRSTSGYVFTYKNCLVTWNSGKQKTISFSSTEAEYIALTTAVNEANLVTTIIDGIESKSRRSENFL